MPLYSSSDFASKLGVSKAAVSQAIKGGRIVISKDGTIDSEHKTNKAFAAKQKPGVKKHGGDRTKVKRKLGPRKRKEQPDEIQSDIARKLKAEGDVKEKQVLRLQAAADLTQFKVDRMRGEYLPTAMVKGLFSITFQSMPKMFQHSLEAMLTDLSAKYKINRNDQAEQRKKIIEEVNLSIERSIIEIESKLATMVESVMSQKSA